MPAAVFLVRKCKQVGAAPRSPLFVAAVLLEVERQLAFALDVLVKTTDELFNATFVVQRSLSFV